MRNYSDISFAGDKFWLYDSHQRPNVPISFPQHISEWGEDVSEDLDDVIYLPSGFFYFFKDQTYQRYNNFTGLVRNFIYV